MSYQNISATLSAADKKEILDALTAITAKLPFLVALTPEERRKCVKMGDKSLGFMEAGQAITRSNPEIFPGSFNAAEYVKDIDLFKALNEVQSTVSQLAAKLDDTQLALGSEIMQTSLDVYKYAKTAAKRTPGIKAAVEQMSARFKGMGRTPAPNGPKPPQ